MTDVRPAASAPPPGHSVLVFGSGESPMAILAAALARKTAQPFGWANCSGSIETFHLAARRILEGGSDPSREPRVEPRELAAPPAYGSRLATLLATDEVPMPDRTWLADYLAMPLLIQRLVARLGANDGSTAVVLTNVDALPPSVAESGLAQRGLHETLARDGVTLLVTYRGTPPNLLAHPFDRVYRIEGDEGPRWGEAVISTVRGSPSEGMPSPAPLREWLPWLGLTSAELDGARSGFGHYLR